MKLSIIGFLLLVISFLQAQPASEIFLLDVRTKNGKMILSNPRNITNHPGYDNQPSFHPGKPILYYASANEDGRTEIIQYDYKSNKRMAITKTNEREYSPTVTPDMNFLSCILQREDGKQDLVKYPIGGGEAQILIENLIVGYHAWADDKNIFVFTLPAPFKLQHVDLLNKTNNVVAENIGRSLHKIPNQNAVSFTQKKSENQFDIMRYDLDKKTISEIATGLLGTEADMCWTPGSIMLRTVENTILEYDELEKHWIEIKMNLKQKSKKLNSFTRLAMSKDGKTLAVVVTE